jgi:hypothetical protein
MTIYDLMKSIGARFVRCFMQIATFAAVSIALYVMGKGFYLVTAKIASFMPDPWFGYTAYAFRIIFLTAAGVVLLIAAVCFEYRFFCGSCQDINRYFDVRWKRHRTYK